MAKNRIKLSRFADEQGMAYGTIYKHWQAGNIEGIQLPSGTILVTGWKNENKEQYERELAIIYSRVSTTTQKLKLKNQTTELTKFAQERDYQIIDTVEEVGTSFSDHRTKLLSILHRTDWNVLVVEDIDSLMTFGYPYLEVMLRRNGQEVISLREENNKNSEDDHMIEGNGEQELVGLINKVRHLMKGLIGIGPIKGSIEKSIESLTK